MEPQRQSVDLVNTFGSDPRIEDYLDTLRGVVEEQLKARHDTDERGGSEA